MVLEKLSLTSVQLHFEITCQPVITLQQISFSLIPSFLTLGFLRHVPRHPFFLSIQKTGSLFFSFQGQITRYFKFAL